MRISLVILSFIVFCACGSYQHRLALLSQTENSARGGMKILDKKINETKCKRIIFTVEIPPHYQDPYDAEKMIEEKYEIDGMTDVKITWEYIDLTRLIYQSWCETIQGTAVKFIPGDRL